MVDTRRTVQKRKAISLAIGAPCEQPEAACSWFQEPSGDPPNRGSHGVFPAFATTTNQKRVVAFTQDRQGKKLVSAAVGQQLACFVICRIPCCYPCSFDLCTSDESESPVENLGQVVFGERIRPSPYKVRGGL